MRFAREIAESHVIPAVRSLDHLAAAVAAPSRIVYLLTGTVGNVGALCVQTRDGGKLPVVNIDLLSGLSSDAAAVAFLAASGAAGIISTHPAALHAARGCAIAAIQRSFIIDSQALSNSVRALERFEPDAVELLPALVAPRALPAIRAARPHVPLIAGGMIDTLSEIDALVTAGIDAVSVSDPALWIF
jgi:glycerol uptake operon antiterminator